MTMVVLSDSPGLLLGGLGRIGFSTVTAGTAATIDATGEQAHFTGFLVIPDKTSKTFSSAGGKVFFFTGPTTFADAGTTIRVGIQTPDLTNSGSLRGDGTFDVYDDLVGGTDTITSSVINSATMSTGSVSLSNGDHVTIALSMTSRGGSDSVPLVYSGAEHSVSDAMSSTSSYTTSWGNNGTLKGSVYLQFDDGSIGYLQSAPVTPVSTLISFSTSSAQDEHGNLVYCPYTVQVTGITAELYQATTGGFDVKLYADPLGTPTLLASRSIDPTSLRKSGNYTHYYPFSSPVTVPGGTTIAVTVLSTSTNAIRMYYFDFAAETHLDQFWPWEYYAINRDGSTGAFSDYNGGTAKTRVFNIAAVFNAIDVSDRVIGG